MKMSNLAINEKLTWIRNTDFSRDSWFNWIPPIFWRSQSLQKISNFMKEFDTDVVWVAEENFRNSERESRERLFILLDCSGMLRAYLWLKSRKTLFRGFEALN